MEVAGVPGATCQQGLPGAVKPASASEHSQSRPPRCRRDAGLLLHVRTLSSFTVFFFFPTQKGTSPLGFRLPLDGSYHDVGARKL